MKIGLIQQESNLPVEANLNRLCDNIADVATRGAELVVLQELHNTTYFCQTEDVNLSC